MHSLVKDGLGYIHRKISKADKIAQLRKRQELKEIFIDKFGMSPQWPLEDALEALIRNIDRIDEYPEEKIKNPRKGWPFFKVELRGLYHDGIEVYNRVVGLRETESGLFVDYGGGGGAYLIARIPFDWIDHVDFPGDEYDFYPHVFCRFKKRGLPYKECRVERMIFHDGKVVRTKDLGMLDIKTGRII
jgi:hypothetical protein